MEDVLTFAILCATLATLYCLGRAADLFRTHRPAVGTVLDSDYTEDERRDDFWSFGFTIGTKRGWNWRDGENSRLIRDKVSFNDEEGEEHRAWVERRVRRGGLPSGAYPVWYDSRDPAQATAFGPGHWFMMAIPFAILLASLFSACVSLSKITSSPAASLSIQHTPSASP